MNKKKYIILFIFLSVIVVLVLTINQPTKTLLVSCQPDEINYKSWDPYCIWFKSRRRITGVDYYFWVAKKIAPSYGYRISYPIDRSINDKVLQHTIIKWTSEGISVETNSNNRLFIAKNNFIGGR